MRKQSRAVLMLLILLASTIVVPLPTAADDEEIDAEGYDKENIITLFIYSFI